MVSVGPGSYSGKLLTMAHAANVAAGATGLWPRLGLEYIVQVQPKVIIVSTMDRGQDLEREMKFWRELPGLAGRADFRVESVSSDLIDRPGPRLGLGLEALARIIHPERFPPKEGEER